MADNKINDYSRFFGIILGTLAALLRLTKGPFRYLASIYVDFMRGTPLLVQIFIIYYGIPSITGGQISLLLSIYGRLLPLLSH